MAFDIDQVLADMTDAVAGAVADGWPLIGSCFADALRDEKQTLQDIAAAYEAGDLSEEDLASQLDDEKLALESALLACRLQSKVTAQNAANAAIETLTSALKLVI